MQVSITGMAYLAGISKWANALQNEDITVDEALTAFQELRDAEEGGIVSHHTNQIVDKLIAISANVFNQTKAVEFKWMNIWLTDVRAKQQASMYN